MVGGWRLGNIEEALIGRPECAERQVMEAIAIAWLIYNRAVFDGCHRDPVFIQL